MAWLAAQKDAKGHRPNMIWMVLVSIAPVNQHRHQVANVVMYVLVLLGTLLDSS